MKTYVVGGAVRDQLLGLPVQDRDYVVVGATPEELVAMGYTPVGKDFPVFLHPQTREEYALARTERKTAPGYRGFAFHTSPDVTLEADLCRRDLTINAMALDDDGNVIDPFGGQQDLKHRVFRHVSDAFAEDPLRVLRLARFAARFPDFAIASETGALMRQMVASGEVDALVPERVWQELARGLMEQKPSRMFAVLRSCDALARILPELDALWGQPKLEGTYPETDAGYYTMLLLDKTAERNHPLRIRFAVLVHDLGRGHAQTHERARQRGQQASSASIVETVCERLRVPNECRDLAVMVAREQGNIARGVDLGPTPMVRVFERCDAFRRPERFLDMLVAAECDYLLRIKGRVDFANKPYPQARHWKIALEAARNVDTGVIAARFRENPTRIPITVHNARVSAVAAALHDEAIARSIKLWLNFES